MKCMICKNGDTAPGVATVTMERDRSLVVIRKVPAEVCQECGEYYLDKRAAERVLAIGEEAARRNVETEIIAYAA
jgi:YgiT-type zinc finger domain-containing protein